MPRIRVHVLELQRGKASIRQAFPLWALVFL